LTSDNLTGAGLINRIEFDGKNTFVLTPKGRQYLESYQKFSNDVKDDAVCNCGHIKEDHDSEDDDECYYEDCNCKKFESFQLNLYPRKKKKTVTDIKFVQEDQVKDDPLTWNCLYINKYKKKEQ